MNILAKKEFEKNYTEDFVKEYNEECVFLEKLIDKSYEDLSNDEKLRLDAISKDIDKALDEMSDLVTHDYYTKTYFRIMMEFLILIKGEDFGIELDKHYAMLKKYARYVDICDEVYKNIRKRTIYDIKLAHEFCYMCFLTIDDDLAIGDKKLLNRGKFNDSDFTDFSALRKDEESTFASLKYKNRVYNKRKNEEN